MNGFLGLVSVLGLVGALTLIVSCSNQAPPQAPEKKGDPIKKESTAINLGKGVKFEMVLVPSGKFLMGWKEIPVDPFSNLEVEQPEEHEIPQHEVTLTKSFFMGKYEVTQEQWFEIMGNNPSQDKGQKLPVTDVSWEDCQEFIKKLNAKTNGGYRLPTDAEWEYACRAGTTTAYSFGQSITRKDANFGLPSYFTGTEHNDLQEVGSYKPNAFGLYDMHGNVWERCEDWFGPYQAGAVTDPKGWAMGTFRVIRGGAFSRFVKNARSSFRSGDSPTYRDKYTGFRLAMTK